MDGTLTQLLVLVAAAAAAAAVGLAVWRLLRLIPGGRVAQVEAGVQPPHSFELRYVTTAERSYRLATRLRRHGHASGGGTLGGHAPVLCRYRVTVNGRPLVEETVGFGAVDPRKVHRRITTGYLSHEQKSGSSYVATATHVLAAIPRCPAGVEIVAAGNFEPEPGVELSLLDVFLGR